jgi:phage shock protein B
VGHFLGIFFGFVGLVLLLLTGAGVALFRMIKGGSQPGSDPDEARLIQELHQGLSRMEERVESLETILMDQTPDKDKK